MGVPGDVLQHGLRVVTLPARSTLTLEDLHDLATRLEEMQDDEDCSTVLLVGGDGVFCGGVDLSAFVDPNELDRLAEALRRAFRALVLLDRPLVAAVDGLAIGFGFTMLLHADVVISSERAVFQAPFAELGLLPEAASTLLLPARIGHLGAVRMLCLGATLSADAAQSAGLVTELVPSALVSARAYAVARRMAAGAEGAVRTACRLLHGDSQILLDRIDLEITACRQRLDDPTVRRRLAKVSALGRRRAGRG